MIPNLTIHKILNKSAQIKELVILLQSVGGTLSLMTCSDM